MINDILKELQSLRKQILIESDIYEFPNGRLLGPLDRVIDRLKKFENAIETKPEGERETDEIYL